MTNYEEISRQAEADLNTYQAKTGTGAKGLDDAGVNSLAEKKFEDHAANVTYGDELSTNAGYNKRIPPSEGGILDDRGRQARGEQYMGEGGPLDKLAQRDGGINDNDVVPAPVPKVSGLGSAKDIATQGQQASDQNVNSEPAGPHGKAFKGENYYNPESVPGSISAEGYEAPSSVVEASKESEGY